MQVSKRGRSHKWSTFQNKQDGQLDMPELNNRNHPFRHQHLLRKQTEQLAESVRQITVSNKELQEKLSNIENAMTNLQRDKSKVQIEENENDINVGADINDSNILGNTNIIEIRISKLELLLKSNILSVHNITEQISGYDKLHMSMLELLENVENIETKLDKNDPDFRKEISKLEFQVAQTETKINTLKEDQANTRESVKALSVRISNLKDKFELKTKSLQDIDTVVNQLKESIGVQNSKLHDHILKVKIFFPFKTFRNC